MFARAMVIKLWRCICVTNAPTALHQAVSTKPTVRLYINVVTVSIHSSMSPHVMLSVSRVLSPRHSILNCHRHTESLCLMSAVLCSLCLAATHSDLTLADLLRHSFVAQVTELTNNIESLCVAAKNKLHVTEDRVTHGQF